MPDRILQQEARLFTRYLLDREPPPECVDRYLAAHRVLLPMVAGADEAVLSLVRRHPWTLPFLDAASGVFYPQSLLRKKLLLAAAILETSPRSAAEFTSAPTGALSLILRLGTYAAASAAKLALGAALLAVAGRARRG